MRSQLVGAGRICPKTHPNLLSAPLMAVFYWTPEMAQTPAPKHIWFHWTGSELVMASLPGASKVAAMRERSDVAVTIDTDAWPYKAHVGRHAGVVPEFAQAARRYLGDKGGDGFLEQYRTWIRDHTWRIVVRPERVTLIDFGAGRLPSNIPR